LGKAKATKEAIFCIWGWVKTLVPLVNPKIDSWDLWM